jgi:hypothetical protein
MKKDAVADLDTTGDSGIAPTTAPQDPANAAQRTQSTSQIQASTSARLAHWQIRDIDFGALDFVAAQTDETLLAIVASASMIESASDIYTQNLVRYYSTDSEIGEWLTGQWEPEELQHGRALRAYIERVWPAFDWERTFKSFVDDYRTYCVVEELGPTPALEMAARCVVETGTATLYRAIHEYAREPVLRDIVRRIGEDEVRHFKHFYRYFKKYQALEKLNRYEVAKALLGRVAEVRRDDAACAFRHVFAGRFPEFADDSSRLQSWTGNVYRMVKQHYPHAMAAKMLLAPLDLPPKLKPWIGAPLASTIRLIMWGHP